MGIVTADLGISLDGFIAGPRQSLEHPMGEGTENLHRWHFEQPEENASEIAAIVEAGAFIMGRNMFGPIRGEWSGDWRGWWGEEPPYPATAIALQLKQWGCWTAEKRGRPTTPQLTTRSGLLHGGAVHFAWLSRLAL